MNGAEAIDNATAALKKMTKHVRQGQQPTEAETQALSAFDKARASFKKALAAQPIPKPVESSATVEAAVKMPIARKSVRRRPQLTDERLQELVDAVLETRVFPEDGYSDTLVYIGVLGRVKEFLHDRYVPADIVQKIRRVARRRYPVYLRKLKRQTEKASEQLEEAIANASQKRA